jgi:hypothetical protein
MNVNASLHKTQERTLLVIYVGKAQISKLALDKSEDKDKSALKIILEAAE